jgi:hypothetical protein
VAEAVLWLCYVGDPEPGQWCDLCLLPSAVKVRAIISQIPLEPPYDPAAANASWTVCLDCTAAHLDRDD